MKALKYIGGLIVGFLTILTFSNISSAAARGTATCTNWESNAGSIIAKIQILVDGQIVGDYSYKDDGQSHKQTGTWNLGPGSHHVVMIDWTYGDLSPEYSGADKSPTGHPFLDITVSCDSTTTTGVVTTTTAPVVTTVPQSSTTFQPVTTTASSSDTSQVSTTVPSVTTSNTPGTTPTTSVIQTTTTSWTPGTLPATGSNSSPLIAAGVVFLFLGVVVFLVTKIY